MGLFDFQKKNDINQAVKECQSTTGAMLLDVRKPQEFREGHIPGSKNLPLHYIADVEDFVEDMNTPLYVYCYSGARSGQAVAELQELGYTNAKNIGGISSYNGEIER